MNEGEKADHAAYSNRMANLDFYAVPEDMLNLLKFIYAETDCRVFESYSEFDRNLREFTSTEQLLSAFDLAALCASSIMPAVMCLSHHP